MKQNSILCDPYLARHDDIKVSLDYSLVTEVIPLLEETKLHGLQNFLTPKARELRHDSKVIKNPTLLQYTTVFHNLFVFREKFSEVFAIQG
jgi:hypothetical protein